MSHLPTVASRPKRILVTASTFPQAAEGRSPRFVLDLCRALQATGNYRCRVIAPHAPESALSETLEGVEVRRYRYAPTRYEVISGDGILDKLKRRPWLLGLLPFFILGQLYAIRKQVREYQPDSLMVHWLVPQGLVAAMAFLFKKCPRSVWIVHGGDIELFRRLTWLKPLLKFLLSQADEIVCVSTYTKSVVVNLAPQVTGRITVIPMGVEEDWLSRAVSASAPIERLLFLGRLCPGKGVDSLIRSMSLLWRKHPHLQLEIYGEGPEKFRLVQLANQAPKREQIRFEGWLPHRRLSEVFRSGTLLVAPASIPEGLGLTVLEAMASGVPVVGTQCGGIRDLIEDGIEGVLIKKPEPEAIEAAVSRLIAEGSLRERMAQSGRSRVRKGFLWKQVADRFSGLLVGAARI